MNNSSDNLDNQDNSINDNSGLLNDDNLLSNLDDINQDLNNYLTDNFHFSQQLDDQHSNIGLGENHKVVPNDFSADSFANQDNSINDNSGLLNNNDFSSMSDGINQNYKSNSLETEIASGVLKIIIRNSG